eukprot:SAG11_NODE_17483_length_517_cov_1.102871_1_plen_118_part_10
MFCMDCVRTGRLKSQVLLRCSGGQGETDFDLCYAVNFDGMRHLLEAVRIGATATAATVTVHRKPSRTSAPCKDTCAARASTKPLCTYHFAVPQDGVVSAYHVHLQQRRKQGIPIIGIR